MPNINLNYKMVTDIKNNFFTNNRFIAAESLPAEGDFVKGDLIVNIGENANDEAMWLCVESGNPGVWEVVGAGAGGSSSKIVTLKSRVVVNNALSEVNIGVSGFNKATDTLLVFNNARFMVEGVDYEINADSTKIVAMNGNIWNEELANDYVFDFVVFKMMNVNENGDVAVSTANEIVKLKNTVIVNQAVNEVEIGIDGFNAGDDLTVYRNSVYMIEGIDYEVQGNKIISLKEVWNAEGGSDYKFTFEVLKTVAKINPDAVIGMEHLNEDIREAIEGASNIDLSGYATKEELNGKVAQEEYDTKIANLETRVEEAFISANNGKELIASAIGEPLDSSDTFSAMSNDINGLLSTFKTNMMNNGITVESSDKFKQLIDKIATMVEEGEGKSIHYASGDGTISSLPYSSSGYQTYVINTNLDFTPTVLFWTVESLDYEGEYGTKTDWKLYETANSLINVSGSTCLSCSLSDAAYDCNFYLSNVNSESFTLNYEIQLVSYSGAWTENVVYHWYAIGVGEEDTTLRDSLASILEENDIEVTEDDDIASLISKVELIRTLDNKFPDWYTPPSDGVWIEGPTVAYNHIEGDITTYGDNLYITSGYNGSYPKTFYCFNIKSGVMSTKAQLPAVRYGNSIDCVGDKLYCIGGATYSNYWYTAQNTIYCYDPKTNSWTTKSGTLPEIRFGHTSAVVGSTIYILGGSGSGSHTGDGTSPGNSMIYDVLTDTCTTFTSRADELYSSAVVLDNKIYVWGGGYYSNTSCGLLVYDLTLKTWTNRYLDIYRSGSELLEYNGEIYIYNGCSDEYNYAHLYKLNLDDLTLTALTEPLTADYGGSAIVIDDKIYAFGGYANSTADKGGIGYRNTVRVFIF